MKYIGFPRPSYPLGPIVEPVFQKHHKLIDNPMKTKSVYKYLFLIILFQSHIVSADSNDAVPVNINVVTAGTLSNLLGVQVNVVKQLTVTGYLNGTDFKHYS